MENPADANARTDAPGGLALRADENSQPSLSKPDDEKRSSGRGSVRSSYTGPQLAMSQEIYEVLEPVHWLLARVGNPFLERKIAREVGRQMEAGMDAERLRHRLTARFARVMSSEIRDPGGWLLGVALPRWGCGHLDCESGVMWSTGRRCAVCEEVVADRSAARRRAQRTEQGLCPDHGARPGPGGHCAACELDDVIRHPASVPAVREPDGLARSSCGGCGARILLAGRALEDGLCRLCREEAAAPPALVVRARLATCPGAGGVPCGRTALPSRSVCGIHRVQELALAGQVA